MLRSLINKSLSLLVLIRFGKSNPPLFYFYRDTYYCRLVQAKYFIRDYIIKKRYKTLSFSGEFAPEIQFALPHAYWHFKNGTLKGTKSSKYTKELYFFSERHEEVFDSRTNESNYNFEMPRVLYSHDYDMKKWLQVPLKKQYENNIFLFEKPVLVIANRFNMEWDGPPISFYSIEILDTIINLLKHKYSIIYNRPTPQNIATDESEIYELNDYEWLRKNHRHVILMEDLYAAHKDSVNNFNHLQLMVYANSEKFISIHGGTATLASYFGGTNIILSKKGPEHHFNCFEKLYPKFSHAQILHAKTDQQVIDYIKSHYI